MYVSYAKRIAAETEPCIYELVYYCTAYLPVLGTIFVSFKYAHIGNMKLHWKNAKSNSLFIGRSTYLTPFPDRTQARETCPNN